MVRFGSLGALYDNATINAIHGRSLAAVMHAAQPGWFTKRQCVFSYCFFMFLCFGYRLFLLNRCFIFSIDEVMIEMLWGVIRFWALGRQVIKRIRRVIGIKKADRMIRLGSL